MSKKMTGRLNLPRLKSWEERVSALLKDYAGCLASGNPSELAGILMPSASLVIVSSGFFLCGSQEIVDFWKTQIKKGLTGVSFGIEKIFPAPGEILNKENQGYHRYDTVFYVLGRFTANLKSGKARGVLPVSRFCLIMRHSENCPVYLSDHIFY